jgi:hypothetical protein
VRASQGDLDAADEDGLSHEQRETDTFHKTRTWNFAGRVVDTINSAARNGSRNFFFLFILLCPEEKPGGARFFGASLRAIFRASRRTTSPNPRGCGSL